MDFASYTDDPVGLAVDLVNTYGWVSGTDSLRTAADLAGFLAARDRGWDDAVPAPAPGDLEAVRSLRLALHEVFESTDADDAASRLNRILADSRATPLLSTHGGTAHLHFEPATRRLPDWLAVTAAMGLATVIAEEGFDRLGVCGSEACRDVFVDTSRNRSRRHCSDGCRTRENVNAYRRRQRADG